MLIINVQNLSSELEWICSVLFDSYLGIKYSFQISEINNFRLSHAGRHIELPNVFFSKMAIDGLAKSLLPEKYLTIFECEKSGLNPILVNSKIPVIFGFGTHCMVARDVVQLPIDIIGSAFFMLSRYEEMFGDTPDQHNRFPATASVAFYGNFLDRPIIDEYVEILWSAINHLWPHWVRKERIPRTLVSCDIDHPFDPAMASIYRLGKRIIGRVWREKSLKCVPELAMTYWMVRQGSESHDPYHQAIDWIMSKNTAAGNRVAFYIIPEKTDEEHDNADRLDTPRMRRLIRRIHAAGHEIGIHFGYNTYRDPVAFARSVATFRKVMTEEGVIQTSIGSRQHYLRWETPTTACLLDDNGLTYDTTLSFADRPGFRCGTCHEYPMYDLIHRRALTVIQRPLVTMEADRYQGVKFKNNGLEVMQKYKDICFKFNGNFTMLWHNSYFENASSRITYSSLIEPAGPAMQVGQVWSRDEF